MVVVGHDGTQSEIATWVGVNGATALPSGNTTMQKDQIKSVQLVDVRYRERCCCNQTCEYGSRIEPWLLTSRVTCRWESR